MRKPDVKAWYLAECESFRMSGKARRLHRLQEIAESDKNLNAAVTAIRVAEGLEPDLAMRNGAVTMPGLVVVIQGAKVHRTEPIDVTPRHDREPDDAA